MKTHTLTLTGRSLAFVKHITGCVWLLFAALAPTLVQAASIPAGSKSPFLGHGAAGYREMFVNLYQNDSTLRPLNLTFADYQLDLQGVTQIDRIAPTAS